MFCRNCCCVQLLITELFVGPICGCRLVWLVGLQFYNHPWHLLLKPCPWYLCLSCCSFSVLGTKFNPLRALPEIPAQEICSMVSPGRARLPSERRQRLPISKFFSPIRKLGSGVTEAEQTLKAGRSRLLLLLQQLSWPSVRRH